MKMTALPLFGLVLLAIAPSWVGAGTSNQQWIAKITLRDGKTETSKLDGVGCPVAICSRTAIKAKTDTNQVVKTWFQSLAAIRDTTPTDALFVFRDGTSRRLSLINDFRVLYLQNRLGRAEKLDLATVKAIEFLRGAGSH
jgi:hypothetical protein